MRPYFLAIVLALGLIGCAQLGVVPDNTEVNSNIIYSGAGGGE